eukprot:TRINITY_DN332_c0_g1::TRINITY_DN332_c0_g1_i1::g.7592::m.7592 TRINITY_DN332_c0_g1::TRINITY_DN332_c0_g1_i1::g.7592  ORF type:complete len:149 (-),score=-1.31,DUF4124/PF13511.1/0.2 TRINITY_DN332_c0_g1_i1:4-450(-)
MCDTAKTQHQAIVVVVMPDQRTICVGNTHITDCSPPCKVPSQIQNPPTPAPNAPEQTRLGRFLHSGKQRWILFMLFNLVFFGMIVLGFLSGRRNIVPGVVTIYAFFMFFSIMAFGATRARQGADNEDREPVVIVNPIIARRYSPCTLR